MTVFAGDEAIYRPARGEAEHVLVDRRTPKRVRIIIRRNLVYLARYVKPERLERRGGGAARCRG